MLNVLRAGITPESVRRPWVYEDRLFEVIKVVVNTHVPGSIPEKATVSIDFGEISELSSETDRLEAYQRRLDLGIWSPVDVFMADNPDIRSREDALKTLQERREEAAVLGVAFAGPRFEQPEPVDKLTRNQWRKLLAQIQQEIKGCAND